MAEESDKSTEDDWAAAMAEQADSEGGQGEADQAEPVGMEQFADGAHPDDDENPVNFDVIMDVPVNISMEIGRTAINIRNLLQLNQGSIVELDRLAGEPLDVLVNGTLIARGEVVVINEKFGIRLTDVISPAERLRKLR
ncbi:flagellar motor switch protein FliN [Guyparkeria hydrothermalis]|uniref:flagellar motor switch protein FliN n=1 Tax=Guyparkeria hydrothermalis TaxID=923 RepID=UPI0020222E28|nr:flagellar motor switch protein FliN [Guyparkeria hydrothermalis]MCL7752013.1 flagellar motor switch protein FliN [Guyparkeria hydrothermalis]